MIFFSCCSGFSADVANQKGQLIGCVNNIITQFGFAHPVCKMKLLVTHGYSFNGSSLWDIYGNACNHLYTTWNIAICRLYELPRTAHTILLFNITNLPHIKHNLKCRFLKTVNNVTKSCNNKMKFLAKICISNTFSLTGCNISNILCQYKISIFDIFFVNNVCGLMNKSNTKSNNIINEEW